jgi:hypothetical protein
MLTATNSSAQGLNCTLKSPAIIINFGSGKVSDINEATPANYSPVSGPCPNDGYYSFTNATADCFFGDWFTLTEDHTPGDAGGNMMLVNASPAGGVFLSRMLSGLKGGSTYEFKAWMMNVCRIRGGCPPLPPNILVQLTSPSGGLVGKFYTGELAQTAEPRWSPYGGFFTLPAGVTSVVLTMINSTTGGCGNDFALDDITIRECVKPEVIIASLARMASTALTQQVALKKEAKPAVAVKQEPTSMESAPKEVPVKTASRTTRVVQKGPDTQVTPVPKTEPRTITSMPVPPILRNRENPLIKQIEAPAGELRVDLYDNGTIDGDTVSVYHNNQLVVAQALLGQKPLSLRIKVNAAQPHHELIMVAHNLGSIPPNTALMIVTTGDKRYEAFLSSSEQKNARVLITLKE